MNPFFLLILMYSLNMLIYEFLAPIKFVEFEIRQMLCYIVHLLLLQFFLTISSTHYKIFDFYLVFDFLNFYSGISNSTTIAGRVLGEPPILLAHPIKVVLYSG